MPERKSQAQSKEIQQAFEQSLQKAAEILKKYQAPGILFGSSLSFVYNGASPRPSKPHDIDVLVLSLSCENHPCLSESYSPIHTDWWVTHDLTKRPHNRNTWHEIIHDEGLILNPKLLPNLNNDVGLYWFISSSNLEPGLYVMDPQTTKAVLAWELQNEPTKTRQKKIGKALTQEWATGNYHLRYPILNPDQTTLHLLTKNSSYDPYCKP